MPDLRPVPRIGTNEKIQGKGIRGKHFEILMEEKSLSGSEKGRNIYGRMKENIL